MKTLLISLASLAAFTLPSFAAEFWAERPSYLRLFSSRLPRITGQVTLSATEVLQSEVELFDLKPDMLEYAEHLARHQSLTYRINPCFIRKTSPPAIVQNEWVDNVVTPVIRFYLATDKLVPVPPPYFVPDPFDRGM
jgi:hypothetical protein